MQNLSLSLITATFNSGKTLQETFNSIHSQSYKNYQHIVVDGLSIDNTLEIINNNINYITHFISEKDNGIYDALNKGLDFATGDVIGFIHSDDTFASNNILSIIANAFTDPTVQAVYGDLVYISKNENSLVRKWKSCAYKVGLLKIGWMPPHPTLFIRKEWYLQRNFRFDLRYQISADYKLILQLFKSPDFNSIYLPITLVKMRVGGVSNRSLKFIVQKSIEDWKALRSCGFFFHESFIAIIFKNISKIKQFFTSNE